jgi:hypothetical protein
MRTASRFRSWTPFNLVGFPNSSGNVKALAVVDDPMLGYSSDAWRDFPSRREEGT